MWDLLEYLQIRGRNTSRQVISLSHGHTQNLSRMCLWIVGPGHAENMWKFLRWIWNQVLLTARQQRKPLNHHNVSRLCQVVMKPFRYEHVQSFSGTIEKLRDSQIHSTVLHIQQKLTGFCSVSGPMRFHIPVAPTLVLLKFVLDWSAGFVWPVVVPQSPNTSEQ